MTKRDNPLQPRATGKQTHAGIIATPAPERAVLDDAAATPPFWAVKALKDMSPAEWESVCDGCGKCCLEKIEDPDTGRIHFTSVACRLLNIATCRCNRYADRKRHVRNCEQLTPENVRAFTWLPSSCAYRLLAEGKDLPWWHHLVSGDRSLVHRVGASARGRAISPRRAGRLEQHVVQWPT